MSVKSNLNPIFLAKVKCFVSHFRISRVEYKSALCQGQASSALNAPSCACREMGEMNLEGSYWGGEGASLTTHGFHPNP